MHAGMGAVAIFGSLGLLTLAVLLVLWVVSDAMNRGKPPLLVVIAVVFFFPFGLIAWLLFRPPLAELPSAQPR
jgi:hypothetical protein